MKIKGTAELKIYDPNIPGSERYINVENYVTERMYRVLYHATNGGYNVPFRPGHLNVYVVYRTNYVINKTGYDMRFSTTGTISPGLLAIAGKPTSQPSPVAYSGFDVPVPFVQFYNRLEAPGFTRTFNIIGLTGEVVTSTTVYPLTILQVEPACVQGPTEVIDIVYNLEITKGTSYYYISQFQRDWVNYYVHGGSPGSNGGSLNVLHHIMCSYCALPKNVTQANGYEFVNASSMSYFHKYNITNAATNNNPFFLQNTSPMKHGKWVNLSPNDVGAVSDNALGFVINTLFIGTGSHSNSENVYSYYWETNPSIGTSPFQSKFNKKSNADYPFWEAADTPNSSGNITFGGTWSPNTRFPEIIKILLVNGGSVGTATYRIQVKKFVRLSVGDGNSSNNNNAGNTWNTNRGEPVPFLNPLVPHSQHHGTGLVCPKTKWKGESVVMYDMTGVTLLNLYDGNFITWDASTTPAMAATAICQCETLPSDNTMYVACRNTGLYQIVVTGATTSTVSKLSSEGCYGVCVGGSGKVYAIFAGGRIANSDNWSTPLALASAGITSGNTPDGGAPAWSRVRYIKANPWDTTDKLAIIITSGTTTFANGNTTTGYVVWWSPTLNGAACTIFNHTSGNVVTSNPNAVNCHPSEDCWIIPGGCLAKWGNNGTGTGLISSTVAIPHSNMHGDTSYNSQGIEPIKKIKYGWANWFGDPTGTSTISLVFYYANFYNGYVLADNDLINPLTGAVHMNKSTTYLETSGSVRQGGTCLQIEGDLYLQWGFVMTSHYQLANIFRTHATNGPKTQGWIDYGWDGSSWVEGSTVPRTTHTAALPMHNGVTVAFANGNVANIESFVPGQYMLQYMCYGVLVDNTTSWYYEPNRYFTEYVTASFPQGFTVPTASPYEIVLPKYRAIPQSNEYGWVSDGTTNGIDPDPLFYAADMLSKRSFNISIGGTPVLYTALFHWNGTSGGEKALPGPGEVSIEYTADANRTNRRLRFNAADAGKAITGTYVYMRCPT